MTENMPEDPTGLRYYGLDTTIHSGGEVNVELDKYGMVIAVWYRCQPLPFTQRRVTDERAVEMMAMYVHNPAPLIEAVVLKDKP